MGPGPRRMRAHGLGEKWTHPRAQIVELHALMLFCLRFVAQTKHTRKRKPLDLAALEHAVLAQILGPALLNQEGCREKVHIVAVQFLEIEVCMPAHAAMKQRRMQVMDGSLFVEQAITAAGFS